MTLIKIKLHGTGEWNNKENEVAYMGTYKEQNNALIGYIPKTDKNMKSVDCFAPQWNTTSWDKRTIPLTIQCNYTITVSVRIRKVQMFVSLFTKINYYCSRYPAKVGGAYRYFRQSYKNCW